MTKHASRNSNSSDAEAAALESAWNQIWPTDKKHPIVSALRSAYLQRLVALVAAAKTSTVETHLVHDLKQIGKWIFEPIDGLLRIRDPRMHFIEAGKSKVWVWVGPPHLHEVLTSAGLNQRLGTAIVRILAQPLRGPGAPLKASNIRLAIECLQAKRSDPKFSWQRFANNHCSCGQSKHNAGCRGRIRTAAIELQRLLKRLCVTF